MIEFGETLRKTREANGLTQSQIAERTHMMVQQIDALEREDFSRIAAPIYGRGFVKLYCEALGLDPKPFIDEFMAIYGGTREPSIKMRKPVRETPAPAPAAPAAETPAPMPDDIPDAVPEEPPSAPEPAKPEAPSVFDQTEPPARQPARARQYAPAYDDEEEDEDGFRFSVPPALWRILALGAGAALALWLVFSLARFIYNVSMGKDAGEEVPSAETSAAAEAPAPAAPAPAQATARPAPVKRTPIKVKPLYID